MKKVLNKNSFLFIFFFEKKKDLNERNTKYKKIRKINFKDKNKSREKRKTLR